MHQILRKCRGPLISSSLLNEAIQAKHPIRILNTTLGRPLVDLDNNAVYLKERIPKASFLDIDKVADHPPSGVSHQTPLEKDFIKFMEENDVSNQDNIILYDDHAAAGACKFWWTFKQYGINAFVLDGGFKAWKAANLAVETGAPTYVHRMLPKGYYQYRLNSDRMFDFNDVNTCSYLIRNHNANMEIVDARAPGRFKSEVPEPRPGLRSGNIPGSKNLFFKNLLNEDGTFKSSEAILAEYTKAGVDVNKEIVYTCGSSVTGSLLDFGLELTGKKTKRFVYQPSWSEYGMSAQLSDKEILEKCVPASTRLKGVVKTLIKK
jgi:thiosulfate/3-mercaptopyruvate sulfurtransferase